MYGPVFLYFNQQIVHKTRAHTLLRLIAFLRNAEPFFAAALRTELILDLTFLVTSHDVRRTGCHWPSHTARTRITKLHDDRQ